MGNVHRWLFFVRVEAGGHDVSEEVLDTVTVYLHPTFR